MRAVLLAAAVGLGCSGANAGDVFSQALPQAGQAGASGSSAGVAGLAGSAGLAGAGASSSGAAGQAGAAGTASTGGAAGASGTSSASGAAGDGGSAQGGAGAAGSSGQGGSGGQVDPLAPVPSPGCDGYFDYLVPAGTCIWVHGRFALQGGDTCGHVANGITTDTCKTVTTPVGQPDWIARISGTTDVTNPTDVAVTRYDHLNGSSCPKACP